MSRLLLVRHGRASAFAAAMSGGDYDKLSEDGWEQSRLLGAWWAEACAAGWLSIDAVFVGPRRRHAETRDAVAEAMRARGLAWPEAIELPELDEHDGLNVLLKLLPELSARDEGVRSIVSKMSRGEPPTVDEVASTFKRVTRLWARGELAHDEIEAWTAFRRRVESGLAKIAEVGRGKTVVAFTSAGAIAASVSYALALDDEKVLELSWSLNNGSISELAFSEKGWGLHSFNTTPHLREPRLITSV